MSVAFGWIIVTICAFLLVRGYYYNNIVLPIAANIIDVMKNNAKALKPLNFNGELRNSVLWVCNPLWWSPISAFKQPADRGLLKRIYQQKLLKK